MGGHPVLALLDAGGAPGSVLDAQKDATVIDIVGGVEVLGADLKEWLLVLVQADAGVVQKVVSVPKCATVSSTAFARLSFDLRADTLLLRRAEHVSRTNSCSEWHTTLKHQNVSVCQKHGLGR